MKTRILLMVMLAGIGLSGKGQIMFQKTYGGGSFEFGHCVQLTNDGGYIITGYSDILGNNNGDIYVVKTNTNGDMLWNKTFGENSLEIGRSVQQTTDGGYIITGSTLSFGSGNYDVYLIKTDTNGDTLWTRTYGGSGDDEGNFVVQTTDGGFAITGTTNSYGSGGFDVYLIKTNTNGDTLWTKTYGGMIDEKGYSIQQTTDRGYIITGYTESFGAGSKDVYLIKTDSVGAYLWSKTYGGSDDDGGYSVQQTNDSGYIITGGAGSFNAGIREVYLIKTNSLGDTIWTKTYGGIYDDYGMCVQQTTDNGYIISGHSLSFYPDSGNAYLIKTNSMGDTLWTKDYGGLIGHESGDYVRQTGDGGYIIAGTTLFGAGAEDVYLIKTDSFGNSGCNQDSPHTIQSSTSTQVTSPPTHVSFGGILTYPHTIVNSGGIVSNLCFTVGINEIIPTPSLLLAPNPFSSTTTLTLQGSYHSPTLFSYNLMGQEVKSIAIGSNKQVIIPRNGLAAGMYFYQLVDNTKVLLGTGKIIVE